MSVNSQGLFVSNTKKVINELIEGQREFILTEKQDSDGRSVWKVLVNGEFSLIINLYSWKGLYFLNVSTGLANVPAAILNEVALTALQINETLGLIGRMGLEGSVLSLSFQFPIQVVDLDYMKFSISHAHTLAIDMLEGFRKFDLVPLMMSLNQKSSLN